MLAEGMLPEIKSGLLVIAAPVMVVGRMGMR
jgi:hypothetical protein